MWCILTGKRKNQPQPLPSELFHPDMNQTTAEQPKNTATGDQPGGKPNSPTVGCIKCRLGKLLSGETLAKQASSFRSTKSGYQRLPTPTQIHQWSFFTTHSGSCGWRWDGSATASHPQGLTSWVAAASTPPLCFLIYLPHNVLSRPCLEMFRVNSALHSRRSANGLCSPFLSDLSVFLYITLQSRSRDTHSFPTTLWVSLLREALPHLWW